MQQSRVRGSDTPPQKPRASQSPYGAKRLATRTKAQATPTPEDESQSPYGAKWFATEVMRMARTAKEVLSQSPYGAMWFATKEGLPPEGWGRWVWSQSPYGAKRFATGRLRVDTWEGREGKVAIPLRG